MEVVIVDDSSPDGNKMLSQSFRKFTKERSSFMQDQANWD